MTDEKKTIIEKIYPYIYVSSIALSGISALCFLYLYFKKGTERD